MTPPPDGPHSGTTPGDRPEDGTPGGRPDDATHGDRAPGAAAAEDAPVDAPVDLSAILSSERELGAVADRRASWRRPAPGDVDDPLRMLAALAGDVDDDTPLPGTAPAPAASGPDGCRRRRRGRRWGAALAGVAVAVIGMTGAAAAGSNVLAPVSGLFRNTPTTEPVTGSHPSHTGEHNRGHTATATPAERQRTTGPAAPVPRRTAGPRTTRYAPAVEDPATPSVRGHRHRSGTTPAPGIEPTAGGATHTPSPAPSETRTGWSPPGSAPSTKPRRLEREATGTAGRGTPPGG